MKRLTIATRASRLALWQSEYVAAQIRARHPELVVELQPMTTTGDRLLGQRLADIGGKGLFIKELEQAMLAGRADIAVHSIKDLPAELPEGFEIGAILAREDPRDVLVTREGLDLGALKPGARVGTSSLRRQSQILAQRSDLSVIDVRGNVPTRLAKLETDDFDAIILAAAGLKRLDLLDRRCRALSPEVMLPAVGQGAIGVETRRGDAETGALIADLNCSTTHQCVSAERAMNEALGGSCHVPVAGHATMIAGRLRLSGLVASVDGRTVVQHTAAGSPDDPSALGRTVGSALLAAGGERILSQLAI